jgi:hypothetical protein
MDTPSLTRRLTCWLLLAHCATACSEGSSPSAGSPTPEPPDHLPTPDFAITASEVDTLSDPREPVPPIPLSGPAGSVQGDTDVWIVNLDRPLPPERVRAAANGSFTITLTNLHLGDRVRVVSRSATRHSLPFDFRVQGSPTQGMLVPVSAARLSCLSVIPQDDLTVVVPSVGEVTRALVIDNACGAPLRVVAAGLRFGDQGIRLAPAGATLAVGRSELAIGFDGHALPSERADIVLLDVASATGQGRYAIGVYSVSSASLGTP